MFAREFCIRLLVVIITEFSMKTKIIRVYVSGKSCRGFLTHVGRRANVAIL